MSAQNLQKNADQSQNDLPPKEVLNAAQTAQHYSFHLYPATTQLAPFVEYYWIMRWDLRGKPAFMAEVIPSPYTNLTFMPEGARITGVTTGKYTYQLKGKGAIIGAKFRPGALHAFWKASIQQLTDTHVPASHLFTEVDEDYNRTMLRCDDGEAVRRMNALLQARKPVLDAGLSVVTKTLAYLESATTPSLAEAAKHVSRSERRLQELFREYVGVGIKWIILRARLIKAAELAVTPNRPSWTSIAQELGYADQSHFTNDFKRVIGMSPVKYAAQIQVNKAVRLT